MPVSAVTFTKRSPTRGPGFYAVEAAGLRSYANENAMSVEACFETLLTGLAVRYYNAVAA